jgi:hypothetical protein
MVSLPPGREEGRSRGEWLIYVARGTAVLAEYTAFINNFPVITAQCLQRLPTGTFNL